MEEVKKPKRELAKGMMRKGGKHTPESIAKQKETMRRKAAERKQAKLVAEALLSGDCMDIMLSGIYNKATKGDVKACELLLKLVGEMPKEEKSVEIVAPITEVKITSTLDEDGQSD